VTNSPLGGVAGSVLSVGIELLMRTGWSDECQLSVLFVTPV